MTPSSARERKAVFTRISERPLCWSMSLAGGYIGKGILYLLIAFLLGLVLWWLSRLPRKMERGGKRGVKS